jgi:hypothetical protein
VRLANSILGGPNHYYTSGATGFGGDMRAAYRRRLLASSRLWTPAISAYQTALDSSLAMIADPAARDLGIATGNAYANAVLGMRSADGSTASAPYVPTDAPGDYMTTGAGNAALPHWGGGHAVPDVVRDQFRPAPPPALESPEYAVAYNEVKEIGSASSATRTADQTASALFWYAANGAPWTRIGLTIAEDEGLSTLGNARVFALLSSGLADALIAGFGSKYAYRFWRPVSAIHEGDADGNPLTERDAGWTSVFGSPLHPSYMSTHSALSGAGENHLDGFLRRRRSIHPHHRR